METLRTESHTLIFYESTHRILECLDDIGELFGQTCEIVLAKELTKTFERFITGTLLEVKKLAFSRAGACERRICFTDSATPNYT